MKTFWRSRIGGLFFLSSLVLFLSYSCDNKETGSVYICLSKGAYAYHQNSNCKGIKRCSHEIREVSLEEAKGEYDRQLCGFED